MEHHNSAVSPGRNNSIDIARLILSVIVITNHTKLYDGISEPLRHCLEDYLPRITVPFFFCVSGYYYIQSLLNGKGRFVGQLKSVLKPYITWTLVYYSASFVVSVLLGKTPVTTFLTERVVYFFTKGSFYHFWYFPALIYAIIMTTAVFKLFGRKGLAAFSVVSFFLCMIGALGTAYYPVGQNIPVLSDVFRMKDFATIRFIVCLGFAYFTAGYWIVVWQKRSQRIRARGPVVLLIICASAFLAEIVFLSYVLRWTEHPELIFSTYFLSAVLLAYLLRHPLFSLRNAGWHSKWLSGFVYYIHPLLLVAFSSVQDALGFTLSPVVMFLSVTALSLLLGFICLYRDNRMTRALLGKASDKSKPTAQASSPSKC